MCRNCFEVFFPVYKLSDTYFYGEESDIYSSLYAAASRRYKFSVLMKKKLSFWGSLLLFLCSGTKLI